MQRFTVHDIIHFELDPIDDVGWNYLPEKLTFRHDIAIRAVQANQVNFSELPWTLRYNEKFVADMLDHIGPDHHIIDQIDSELLKRFTVAKAAVKNNHCLVSELPDDLHDDVEFLDMILEEDESLWVQLSEQNKSEMGVLVGIGSFRHTQITEAILRQTNLDSRSKSSLVSMIIEKGTDEVVAYFLQQIVPHDETYKDIMTSVSKTNTFLCLRKHPSTYLILCELGFINNDDVHYDGSLLWDAMKSPANTQHFLENSMDYVWPLENYVLPQIREQFEFPDATETLSKFTLELIQDTANAMGDNMNAYWDSIDTDWQYNLPHEENIDPTNYTAALGDEDSEDDDDDYYNRPRNNGRHTTPQGPLEPSNE